MCRYANGVQTTYEYDPETFRLVHLRTTRLAVETGRSAKIFEHPTTLQDLRYTYDPIGNVARIHDAALKTVFHANREIEPACEYSYDPTYRLIEATGREHIGQSAFDVSPVHSDDRDYPFAGAERLNDLEALQRYVESYAYDPAGNILATLHRAAHRNWTRAYAYREKSLLEPTTHSNRLSETALETRSDAPIERYRYDANGNTTHMPHLPSMEWNYKDQLNATSPQVVNEGSKERETTYYVYDASGQRARKVTERECGKRSSERFYVGGFELFREFFGDDVAMERETLHIMDDTRRIALVETKTIADGDAIDAPAPEQRYQLTNYQGSASVEMDEAGGLITYEEYSPFGNTTYQAGFSAADVRRKRYRYTAKERDRENGFTYHGSRYCAPWLGRWTQADPTGIAGGLNLYAYGSNNPVRLVDRGGKDPTPPEKKDPPPESKEKEQTKSENAKPPEKKNPQPTVYNAGPTQTAFVPGDVSAYGPHDPNTLKAPLGSVAFEGNLFVLPDSTGTVTSYVQIAGRWRTSDDTEQGFLAQVGGQTGSSSAQGSVGYQLHQGTKLDTRDEAPFQKGQGNWFTLSLAATPLEKVDSPTPGSQARSDTNLTSNYLHAWSYAWGGGNTAVDVNAGANAAVRGSVYGRDVWGFVNPYVGANVSHQFGSVTLNLEGTTGPATGIALANPKAGDPSVPISLHTNLGLGVQTQVGDKGDYTIGAEVLGNFDTPSTISGPVPWGLGFALTVSAY